MTDWPVAELDNVQRARVLAAAMPGAGVVESTFDVPFDRYWSFVSDLERSVPAFDPHVRSLVVESRDGERIVALATQPSRIRARFDVDLTDDGWCLMVARRRLFTVVMAAVPDGPDRTRAIHVEAVPRRAGRLLRPFMQRNVRHDVAGIRRSLGGPPGP